MTEQTSPEQNTQMSEPSVSPDTAVSLSTLVEKTPEQIAGEESVKEFDAAKRKLRALRREAAVAIIEPTPITEKIDEIIAVNELLPQVDREDGEFDTEILYGETLAYLQSRQKTEEVDPALDRGTMMGVFHGLVVWEGNVLAEMAHDFVPTPDFGQKELQEKMADKKIELRQERDKIALTLIDAYVHVGIPEAPRLSEFVPKSPKLLKEQQYWDAHRDSIGKLSQFMANLQEEVHPLRFIAPTDQKDVTQFVERAVVVDGVSIDSTAGEVQHSFNDVVTKASLRLQFAQR